MTDHAMNDRSVRAWTLALTSLAFFMVALDTLIVITALPAIQRDLGASLATLAWTVNAFTLTFAGGIITAAALGDRYGRRRIFVIGVSVFGAASAACALAPTATLLIAARVVQGAAAAMVMPISLTLLISAFPKERRGAIVGMWGGIAGIAVISGPLVGGAITQGLNWHWIFWINLPIAVVAAALASVRLTETRGPATRLDPVAVLLITGGAVAIVWGLLRAGERGWAEIGALGALAMGAVAIAAFFMWERRAEDPMVPLRVFRSSGFFASTVAGFWMAGSSAAATFLMVQYLQTALGLSPLEAGSRLSPWTGGPLVIAPLAGKVSDHIGRRAVLAFGLLVQGIGLGLLATRATSHATYADLFLPLVVGGMGISIAVTIAPTAAVSAVSHDDVGKASGVSGTMQRFGSAFGIAVASAVFASSGSLDSPGGVVSGVRPALLVVAGMSLLGALAALGISRKQMPLDRLQHHLAPRPSADGGNS